MFPLGGEGSASEDGPSTGDDEDVDDTLCTAPLLPSTTGLAPGDEEDVVGAGLLLMYVVVVFARLRRPFMVSLAALKSTSESTRFTATGRTITSSSF